MNITVTKLKRCDLLKLEGRFDSNTAPELDQAMNDSMDDGVFRIVLDMQDVEYFGSAAIRALVNAYKSCRETTGGDVRLAAVPDRIMHVLELAGIAPLVEIFETPTLAVGSF